MKRGGAAHPHGYTQSVPKGSKRGGYLGRLRFLRRGLMEKKKKVGWPETADLCVTLDYISRFPRTVIANIEPPTDLRYLAAAVLSTSKVLKPGLC